MVAAAGQIHRHCVESVPENREVQHYHKALEEIYRHFQDSAFSFHYLAAEILFMNGDVRRVYEISHQSGTKSGTALQQ